MGVWIEGHESQKKGRKKREDRTELFEKFVARLFLTRKEGLSHDFQTLKRCYTPVITVLKEDIVGRLILLPYDVRF